MTALGSGCDSGAPARVDAAGLGPSGATCPEGSELTYESFGRPFFERYCQSCHATSVIGVARRGAPSSYSFDDLESIRADAEAVDELSAAGPERVNADMPRSYPVPSEEERRRLGEWIACGLP